MSVREPKEDKKTPRRNTFYDLGNVTNIDQTGSDWDTINNDITDVLDNAAGISDYGVDNRVVVNETPMVASKIDSTKTNRRGSRGNAIITTADKGGDTLILNPGIGNVLEKLKNNDSTAFNTDIVESIRAELVKISKIKSMDPIMQEFKKRLDFVSTMPLTAINTELLNQINAWLTLILIELREDRRIRTEDEKIEGKNAVATFSLPVTAGVIRFDFTDLASFIGPTEIANTLQNPPSKKIFGVQITVNSGGPIMIAVNEDDFKRTYVPVATGYEMNCDKATIATINMRTTADASVTVVATY